MGQDLRVSEGEIVISSGDAKSSFDSKLPTVGAVTRQARRKAVIAILPAWVIMLPRHGSPGVGRSTA
jgi:hypothetical protein